MGFSLGALRLYELIQERLVGQIRLRRFERQLGERIGHSRKLEGMQHRRQLGMAIDRSK